MAYSSRVRLLVVLAVACAGISMKAAEADGTTPLQLAVRSGDVAAVRSLLASGADPKAANRYGVTPLFLAVTNRDAAMVSMLLKVGADPKATMPGGETLLMTAAHTGNAEIVRSLLDLGLDVNARENTFGETPLMWAAAENHPEAAKLLIEHGADVNARSNTLKYPKDRFGLEAVYTVLPRGNWTPLMYAARQGSLAAARVLADAHADLNATDPDGTTALVFAIINGHYDTAALLAERGADPNLADATGMAALYAAADMSTLGEVFGRPGRKFPDDRSEVDLMKVLIAHGANVNAQLKSPTMFRAHTPGEAILGAGSTPLMRAARNGDAPAVRLLLDSGADPEIKQKNQTTALMLAAGLGRGMSTFSDEYATDDAMIETVKVLLDHHVDVNATHENGRTALHYAALSLDPVVELLAEHGAKLDVKDKKGFTPLDMALGLGGRGRAGAALPVRQSTVFLLWQLMGGGNALSQANAPSGTTAKNTEARQ